MYIPSLHGLFFLLYYFFYKFNIYFIIFTPLIYDYLYSYITFIVSLLFFFSLPSLRTFFKYAMAYLADFDVWICPFVYL